MREDPPVVYVCHRCGAEWDAVKRQPAVKEVCAACNAFLHCCKNCRFYEPGAHNGCHIPNTDFVSHKERANFCDEFEFREGAYTPGDRAGKARAKDALDSLFGGTLTDEKDGPKDFDSLFGD